MARPPVKTKAAPFALIAVAIAGVLVLIAGLLIGLAFRDSSKGVAGGPRAAARGRAV
jgi:hypothetical protein